jgi:hypothetical protein
MIQASLFPVESKDQKRRWQPLEPCGPQLKTAISCQDLRIFHLNHLIKNENDDIEIYPHIHPEYPEVYIMCIDDENYAISQYLINTKGQSVCRDLSDGEGLYFPGFLGHCNFTRPFYKNIKYCMYMWIIPTFGKVETVEPITIKV